MEVFPPVVADDGKLHSDIMLFNRWTYDDVQRMEVLPPVAPAAVPVDDDGKLHSDIMLFTRWTYDKVQVYDLSVEDYINATASKHPICMPHTAGRYQARRFRKAQYPIVERLTNSLMMHGRNNGKKYRGNDKKSNNPKWRN